MRGRIRDEIERPSSFGSVVRRLVFCNEMTKMGAIEREGVGYVFFV